jgi:hypothetical protein
MKSLYMKMGMSLLVLSLAFGAQASVDEKQYKDDADSIHIRSRVQDVVDEAIASGEDVKDITKNSPRLLALTGKEEQMPEVMKSRLIKKRAFLLCQSHGFTSAESHKPKLLAAVSPEKDFKVVQWLEGNLTPVSASKATHWTTTNDNGRGRHTNMGPFSVFGTLKCIR